MIEKDILDKTIKNLEYIKNNLSKQTSDVTKVYDMISNRLKSNKYVSENTKKLFMDILDLLEAFNVLIKTNDKELENTIEVLNHDIHKLIKKQMNFRMK